LITVGNSILQNKAVYVGNKIMNTFNPSEPRTIAECRKIAEEIFGVGWEAKKEKIYDEGDTERGWRPQIWGIGNCHIDTAWLWPYSVTQQKSARSWATQVS
jgi:alpha-mannosidase